MCGIFGVVHSNQRPVDRYKAESAAKALAHRGPDDYGTFLSAPGNVFFCHYRLSIIELSKSGHQPMTTGDGRFTIVYNGEIYNYKEIKNSESALQDGSLKINNWETGSDTEVILKLYAKLGEECLPMLRGMFAFAIWDEKEKSLFAARDRFGIKPLYYLINNEEFIISSELKAIKQYKNNLTISQQAVDAFLRTGSVPAPLTIYNEIKSLLPGESIKLNHKGNHSLKKWWSFKETLEREEYGEGSKEYGAGGKAIQSNNHITKQSKKYDDEAKRIIHNALLDTITAHMVADVEVGAFLSGGIDSTSIVALMKKAGQEKIRTISVVFPGNKLDESGYAKIAANKYGTTHTEYHLTETEVIDDLNKFFLAIDQPTIDGLNTYSVSRAAASLGLKVVMSGLGGDELFGGYPSFRYIPALEKYLKFIPFQKGVLKLTSKAAKNKIPAKATEFLENPDSPNASYKLFRGLFTDKELKQLGCEPEAHAPLAQMYECEPEAHAPLAHMTPLQHVCYLETTGYMANQLLRDTDVFSMIHSLELRVPFVDHRLYNAAMKYIEKGYNKNKPKSMLIDAVEDLPEEIVNRKKMGFTFPFDEWMKTGKLGIMVMENILDENKFNLKHIEKMIESFKAGKTHWSRIWALYVLNRVNL